MSVRDVRVCHCKVCDPPFEDRVEDHLRRELASIDSGFLSDFIDGPGSIELARLIQFNYAAKNEDAVAWIDANWERLWYAAAADLCPEYEERKASRAESQLDWMQDR